MAYSLPPWLQAADPARYEAEGLRIGDEEAGRAAEQALQQQAGQRAQQELQLRQQELGQQATVAANKYQAQQAYAKDIAAGMPAIDAFLKHAPLMGQAGGMAGTFRAKELSQPKPPPSGWKFVKSDTATGQPASFQMPGKIALPRAPSPPKEPLSFNETLNQLEKLSQLDLKDPDIKARYDALEDYARQTWPKLMPSPKVAEAATESKKPGFWSSWFGSSKAKPTEQPAGQTVLNYDPATKKFVPAGGGGAVEAAPAPAAPTPAKPSVLDKLGLPPISEPADVIARRKEEEDAAASVAEGKKVETAARERNKKLAAQDQTGNLTIAKRLYRELKAANTKGGKELTVADQMNKRKALEDLLKDMPDSALAEVTQ